MAGVFEGRVVQARERMRESAVDLLAVGLGSNLRYLTGFSDEPGERLLLFLVPRQGDPVFLVPELYADQVRETTGMADLRVWRDGEDPGELLFRVIAAMRLSRASVAVDDTLWAAFLLPLQAALPDAVFAVAAPLLASLRMRKGPEEVRAMAAAGEVADCAFADLVATPLRGKSELEVARLLEDAMRKHGADALGFETLVASGPHAALPHHRAGKRRIARDDVIILDYGCRVGGYLSDISRTVVCQGTPARAREVHDLVRRAQEGALDAARPGASAESVDMAARSVIAQGGHAERFLHRTGHGIGLDVHEAPYIVQGNRLLLEPGMAFSIEPGVYVRGEWGVRIEDIVVVTEEGARCLTHSPRDLVVTG